MTDSTDLLVLGGSGPIGRAISRAAQDRGVSVVSASRRGPVQVDVEDVASVQTILQETAPRVLVYLVNTSDVSPAQAAADLETVARTGARHGVERILFASSAAVYGDDGERPYPEGARLAGTSDYARSKILSEQALDEFSAASGVSALSLRIFNVFGPGCGASLITRLAVGDRPSLLLTTAFVRDYVHVDDVACAFIDAAALHDFTGVVNIARGVGIDNRQLADAAGPDAFTQQEASSVRSYSVADVSRVRGTLPWQDLADPLDLLREGRS